MGVAKQVKGSFHIGKAGSQYLILLHCETLLQVLVDTAKVLLNTSFHYTTVALRASGWQSQNFNLKCPNNINTEWSIPEKTFFTLLLEIPDKIRLHP